MKYVQRTLLYSLSYVCHTRMIKYEITAEVVLVTFHINVQGGSRYTYKDS